MTRQLLIWTIAIIWTACNMTEPERHEDFMAHSDCIVYKNETVSETISHGRVEYIDTIKASKCVKEQLKNTYMLYYDNICVAVFNTHPKDNFKLIEQFIGQYHTDSTDLSSFVKWGSTTHLTVAQKCINPADSFANGKYFDRKVIELALRDGNWTKTKENIFTDKYPWQGKK